MTVTRDFTHGAGGYTNHRCRCDTCKNGWSELQLRMRKQRQRATLKNGGIAPTGKHNRNTYKNWACRCDSCCADEAARTAGRIRG